MAEEKLISIVLPIYNGAAHMSASIQSVIQQTYENWELIIVDDCSTDSSLSIAQNFAVQDSRIKVICNERNLKLPKTLNVGFQEACGYYYTWTSDDNMYKPNALKRLVEELEADSSCVMVYSDFTDIDAEGKELGYYSLKDAEYIVTENVIGASFLYRADIAKKVGEFDTNLFLAEDYDYWLRIYREGEIKHIKESLYFYRRHSDSLSETKKKFISMQTYRAVEKNFLAMYADAKKHKLVKQLFDQMLFRVDAESRENTSKMLLSVNPSYGIIVAKKKLRSKLSKNFLGRALKAMKGLFINKRKNLLHILNLKPDGLI